MPRDPITVQTWEIIEDRVFSFEQDFQHGVVRPLREYVPDGNELLRRMILVELIKVDLELKWQRDQRTRLEDYCRQYGELGAIEELPPDLVYEAFRVACLHGAVDSAEKFCEKYPRQRQAVLAMAHRTSSHSSSIIKRKPRVQFTLGARYGDFELLAELGEGAFGKVFLARQVSLARQVALKISANRGSEARTMASLEHDHIVQVFSELADDDLDIRFLCMQYVPGTTLGKIIRHVMHQDNAELDRDRPTGQALVDAIDQLSTAPAIFQASALKEREILAGADRVEATAWLGGRLADALHYAHRQGVLHRDIKPDNVLVSQFGRPYLADFNLSLDPHDTAGAAAGMFGGSLVYMSPEHLDAFNPTKRIGPETVDERSDIYSLGVVLFELLTLQRPFPEQSISARMGDALDEMASVRRRHPVPSARQLQPATSRAIDRVIQKCLHPEPKERYPTAADLADALEAAREHRGIERGLPKMGTVLSYAQRHPMTALILAALVPNLVGSAVNISYNLSRIVSNLTADQAMVFNRALPIYNAAVYPICIAILVGRLWPVWRDVAAQQGSNGTTSSDGHSANGPQQPTGSEGSADRPPVSGTIDQVALSQTIRRRLVSLPGWVLAICCLGWLPGGVAFPVALHILSGPLPVSVFGHFGADLAISGLIALTYSYFFVESIVLRVLYPQFLIGQIRPRETARRELRNVGVRIRILQVAAGLIPLSGAGLLVFVGPTQQDGYAMFRLLVIGLISLGMIGFCFAVSLASFLMKTVAVLTGDKDT